LRPFRIRFSVPLLALALSAPLAACLDTTDTTAPATTAATVETTTFASSFGIDLAAAGWTKTASGLYYRTLVTPTGTAATVATGQRVAVRYTGWLANGTQFESSTYTFALGSGVVIPGWDQGIAGMRVGEKRRLLIPPSLAYGASGYGVIPPNAVLVFDVEVLSAT
jgi:FKBP-type peptidyl-prolyl cis-trans isomerase FkpA